MKTKWENLENYLFIERKLDRSNRHCLLARFRRIAAYFLKRSFTKENLILFMKSLEEEKFKPGTLNNYIKVIKYIEHVEGTSYFSDFSYYKEIEPFVDTLTEEEVLRLKKAASSISPKHEALIQLCCETGMRNREIGNLKFTDLLADRLILNDTKSGKMQMVPIMPDLYEKLSKLPRHNEYVFGSKQGAMKQSTVNKFIHDACIRAGITKRCTSHTIRHSVGTIGVKYNDLGRVQQLLRHKKPETTMRYAKYMLDDIAEVVASISPDNMGPEAVKKIVRKFAERLMRYPFNVKLKDGKKKIAITVDF